MANVFAILSAIALAAAAFLAAKNKDLYAAEITARQEQEKKLEDQTAKHTDLVAEFETTTEDRKETEEETARLKTQEGDLKGKNTQLEGAIAEKKGQADKNAAQISQIEEQLKEVGDIGELVGKIKRTKQEIEESTLAIASTEAKLAGLTSEKTRTEGVINNYSTKNRNYAEKQSFFSSTSIGSIYPAYGFVTLPIGNSSGVVSGSPLNVVRDGAVIAKLRVRSVESGRAAAEIVPDSVAEDTTLMSGDRVVPASAEAAK